VNVLSEKVLETSPRLKPVVKSLPKLEVKPEVKPKKAADSLGPLKKKNPGSTAPLVIASVDMDGTEYKPTRATVSYPEKLNRAPKPRTDAKPNIGTTSLSQSPQRKTQKSLKDILKRPDTDLSKKDLSSIQRTKPKDLPPSKDVQKAQVKPEAEMMQNLSKLSKNMKKGHNSKKPKKSETKEDETMEKRRLILILQFYLLEFPEKLVATLVSRYQTHQPLLQSEQEENSTHDISEWFVLNTSKCPQQKNLVDCGVFCCLFGLCFCLGMIHTLWC